MLPRLAMCNKVNKLRRNTVLFRNGNTQTRAVLGPDHNNLIISKFARSYLATVCMPPFANRIVNIRLAIAKEKMTWIAAGWIIARMKDPQPVWNLAPRK
jgi:hypothetical protein